MMTGLPGWHNPNRFKISVQVLPQKLEAYESRVTLFVKTYRSIDLVSNEGELRFFENMQQVTLARRSGNLCELME